MYLSRLPGEIDTAWYRSPEMTLHAHPASGTSVDVSESSYGLAGMPGIGGIFAPLWLAQLTVGLKGVKTPFGLSR